MDRSSHSSKDDSAAQDLYNRICSLSVSKFAHVETHLLAGKRSRRSSGDSLLDLVTNQ